jgi:hypothetical protein
MKCYKIIHDCDCLDQIADEAMTWIKKNTNLLDSKSYFYNYVFTENFILGNPTLSKWCDERELSIGGVGIMVALGQKGGRRRYAMEQLHLDPGPKRSHINFPVYNCADTYTEWYEVPDIPEYGNYTYLGDRDLSKLQKIAELETILPYFINTTIPHRVRVGPNANIPRIQLAVFPFKDIDHMLEN